MSLSLNLNGHNGESANVGKTELELAALGQATQHFLFSPPILSLTPRLPSLSPYFPTFLLTLHA
jgi:hypothetical protein